MRPALPALLALCALLTGCTGAKESAAESAPATGTMVMAFSVSNGVRENTNLADPLSGAVYGSLFYAEEVTATGPIEGAESLADVEVYGVDLIAAETSAATWTGPELEPRAYRFLGFFDVDANGDASREPEAGDPVTLPSVNEFTIAAGEELSVISSFDIIYN